jgi:hypothetical protein
MPARHRLVSVPMNDATAGPGYLTVCYDEAGQRCPSIGTGGELPASCAFIAAGSARSSAPSALASATTISRPAGYLECRLGPVTRDPGLTLAVFD